jgi:hypothetical protein
MQSLGFSTRNLNEKRVQWSYSLLNQIQEQVKPHPRQQEVYRQVKIPVEQQVENQLPTGMQEFFE